VIDFTLTVTWLCGARIQPLMKRIKADPKLVADQLGHTVDVNQNVYTQNGVELRLPLVNELEKLIF
jgi:hypothetical protein